MGITYGTIPLLDGPESFLSWVEQHITLKDVDEFLFRRWPVASGWPQHIWPDQPNRIKINELYWPCWGASRFAVGHFLIDHRDLERIRAEAYSATQADRYQSLELVMDDENALHRIATNLYMLPARPLTQISRELLLDYESQIYLLTLVDERFYLWEKTAEILITDGTTTWGNLLSTLQSAFGLAIVYDSFESAWLNPASNLNTAYQWLPLLLDAIAYNTGRRVRFDLDGTIALETPVNAKVVQDRQFVKWDKMAGGQFDLDRRKDYREHDFSALVPRQVRLTFNGLTGNVVDSSVTSETVTLESLQLDEYPPAFTGHDGEKALACPALASGEERTALANAFAAAWYRWKAARQDIRYIGIVPYEVETLSDNIRWEMRTGEQLAIQGRAQDLFCNTERPHPKREQAQCGTRVQKGPWNDVQDRLNHTGSLGWLVGCCGTYRGADAAAVQVIYNPAFNYFTGNVTAAGKTWTYTDTDINYDSTTVVTYTGTTIIKTSVTETRSEGTVTYSQVTTTYNNGSLIIFQGLTEIEFKRTITTFEENSEVYFHRSFFYSDRTDWRIDNRTFYYKSETNQFVFGGDVPATNALVTVRDRNDDNLVALQIEATNASRTANLLQVGMGDGTGLPGTATTRVRVDKDGYFKIKPKPSPDEPDDDNIDAGEAAVYPDTTLGSESIKFKLKPLNDGAVITFTVPNLAALTDDVVFGSTGSAGTAPTSRLRIPRLTTADAPAWTSLSGEVVVNTDEEVYIGNDSGGGWTQVGGGGGGVGSAIWNVTSVKTGDYTASFGDFVLVDATASGIDITLPNASGGNGKQVAVKIVVPGNTVVVSGDGDIEGDPTRGILGLGLVCLFLVCDGTDWWIVNEFAG